MISTLALNQEVRGQLETARRDLNLSQAELSEMAGMSQGAISNCLQGKAVRVESLQRLLSALAAAVDSAEERGVSTERAADLKKSIEAARRSMDTSEPTNYFARPGGPMPEDATNRMRRLEDSKLLAALADAPFTAAVTGPPECGKSTLLQLLAAEARRCGFAVAEFDAAMIVPPSTVETGKREHFSEAFFQELAEEVGRTLGERPKGKGPWTRFELLRFLKDTRLQHPAPPLLIVVDHAFLVESALEQLTQICRSLDAQRGRTQMSWAIEVSDLPGRDPLGVLSVLAPSPQIALGFWSKSQVKDIAALYEFGDEEQVQDLWDWFSGQPYLTHAALTRWRDSPLRDAKAGAGEDWNSVVREIESAEFEFGRHLSRVRSRLRYQKINGIEEGLLQNPEFMKLLGAFGLVDNEEKTVKFYRYHSARL